ncbi:MAG: hypothetical protein L6R30_05300 [Thermoanaerobaculia bacterium]|nr:hypothetical protein [Thermoanaerobaculia bacterium]
MGYSFGSKYANPSRYPDWQKIDFQINPPRTIRLAFFWLSNFFGDRDSMLFKRALEVAGPRGFRFDVVPSTPAGRLKHTISWEDVVEEETRRVIRGKCAEIFDDQKAGGGQRFPVIFGQNRGGNETVTDGGWPKYCFISPSGASGGDGLTLLHEIGHGADLEHHDHDHLPIPHANFMSLKPNRDCIQFYQGRSLAEAYFVR